MPPSSARKAQREARRAKVAELLLAGVSGNRIAQMLGTTSRKTIRADIDALLARWAEDQKPEDRDRWRAHELAKLAEMEPAILREAKKGSVAFVDRELRLMERRAKLLGLDAPARQEVTGAEGAPLKFGTVIILPDNGRNDRDPPSALATSDSIESG